MDFFTIILIIAVIYLLPELLRKRNPKEYKYPDVPEKIWPPKDKKITENPPVEPPAYIQHPVQHEPVSPVTYVSGNDNKNAWQENLNESTVVNGIIFAEILSPPLAKRRSKSMHIYNCFKSFK
jgi:hypothetical protein